MVDFCNFSFKKESIKKACGPIKKAQNLWKMELFCQKTSNLEKKAKGDSHYQSLAMVC